MLVLPAGRGRLVRHFVQLTNVAPEYAPPGRHLLSATVLDRRGLDDAALVCRRRSARSRAIYPAAAGRWCRLAVVDVPYAQHRQPAGFAAGLHARARPDRTRATSGSPATRPARAASNRRW